VPGRFRDAMPSGFLIRVLPDPGAALRSLDEHHPTRGHSLIAGAVFHEMTRP
jgi:hypothetical protein